MSELQAITGQLYIVDGVLQEATSAAGSFGLLIQPGQPRAARGRERNYLFVHLTLTGAASDTAVLSQQLLGLISQKFYAATGSVTAALRTAVLEANQLLLRANLGHKGQAREGAISCSVFHQGELFTLQTGESFALLGRNFGIERMPPKEPALITPMGRSASLDIRYYHHRVQAGDLLLLADPRISHLSTDEFNAALVESSAEKGMAELVKLVGDDSARLLFVEFSTEAAPDLPDMRPSLISEPTAVAEPQPRRQDAPTPVATAEADRKPQPQRATPTRQQTMINGKTAVANNESVQQHARQATAQVALGASRFTGWLAELLARIYPPVTEEGEQTGISWTWAAAVAIVIPLLVTLVVAATYLSRDQAQMLADIKKEMANQLSLADVAKSNPEARHYYDNVLLLADQANTQLRPGDSEVARMQAIARENKDRLDGITRLTAVPLYQYSEGTQLQEVALRDGFNGGIFTLDGANNLVYLHETDGSYLTLATNEPSRILFSGQSVGSHIAGSILDLFWRPQGFSVQRSGLAMLDRGGALITYDPTVANNFAASLDLSSEWMAPVAATTFSERLYVLDSGAQTIWKYFPDGDSFVANAGDRAILFRDNPDLANAVDFDIYSEDGGLVILYNDGRIRYYDTRNGRVEWDETVLLANGLGVPLVNPTAVEIVGRGLNATIFIADAGNGRVVQISRPTGRVLAQFQATADDGSELFTDLTDFAIAELPLRIFITKGDTLYRATIE